MVVKARQAPFDSPSFVNLQAVNLRHSLFGWFEVVDRQVVARKLSFCDRVQELVQHVFAVGFNEELKVLFLRCPQQESREFRLCLGVEVNLRF